MRENRGLSGRQSNGAALAGPPSGQDPWAISSLPFRPTALALALAAAVLVPVGPASPASAATWTTVADEGGAEAQACKVLVHDGTIWRVRVRLANRADRRTAAIFTVTDSDTRIVERERTRMRPGRVSGVEQLIVPVRGGYQLSVALNNITGGLGNYDALR